MSLPRFLLLLVVCITLPLDLMADSFEKLVMPGKVIQGHSKYEDTCNKCHAVLDKSNQTVLCLDCHQDINTDRSKKQGYHGKDASASLKKCKTCHIEHVGRDADIVKLDERIFPHDNTDYKLKGAH